MRRGVRCVPCSSKDGQEISVDDVTADELAEYLQRVKDFLRLEYWTWWPKGPEPYPPES